MTNEIENSKEMKKKSVAYVVRISQDHSKFSISSHRIFFKALHLCLKILAIFLITYKNLRLKKDLIILNKVKEGYINSLKINKKFIKSESDFKEKDLDIKIILKNLIESNKLNEEEIKDSFLVRTFRAKVFKEFFKLNDVLYNLKISLEALDEFKICKIAHVPIFIKKLIDSLSDKKLENKQIYNLAKFDKPIEILSKRFYLWNLYIEESILNGNYEVKLNDKSRFKRWIFFMLKFY